MSSSNLNFTRRETKYNKCFWNILHLETATQIISGLAVLASILSVVGFFVGPRSGEFHEYWQLGRILLSACAFIAAVVGIYRVQPKLILVCLIWIATRIGFYAIYALGSLIGFFPNSLLGYLYRQIMDIEFFKTNAGVNNCFVTNENVFLRSIAMLLLYIWIFDLVYKCYKYVLDKAGDNEVALPTTGVSTVSIHQEEIKAAV